MNPWILPPLTAEDDLGYQGPPPAPIPYWQLSPGTDAGWHSGDPVIHEAWTYRHGGNTQSVSVFRIALGSPL